MQTFMVPWSFFMVFNYEQDQLIVHFSKDMKQKNQDLIDPLVLRGDDIRDVIHRYDYRKLMFFSQNPLVQPFDTFLRVKFIDQLGFVKTQAICKSHEGGFNCVLIEDRYFHKLKSLWKLEESKNTIITLMDDTIEKLEKTPEIHAYKLHLAEMFSKVLN